MEPTISEADGEARSNEAKKELLQDETIVI